MYDAICSTLPLLLLLTVAHHWHSRYVFDDLLPLISDVFLAHLAKRSHPCNFWQPISIWQQLWVVPAPPSLIRVGAMGEFSLFFYCCCTGIHPACLAKWLHACNRWQLMSVGHLLWGVPMLPSLLRVGTMGEFSLFFYSCCIGIHLACLAKGLHACNRRQPTSVGHLLWDVPTLPSHIRVGTVGDFPSFFKCCISRCISCNRWQPTSVWHLLWVVPTLPSHISVGTVGEFPSFF